ncbi:MAG TPA: inositol monophosphatase [Methylomirabilota bacterium]|jgi:myo-inositol-1(or 4)-monophosphatase|nr:inositol monophosphatase [Methylomirabilota bacterium]
MSAHDRVGSESRARVAADLVLLGGRLALERFHHAQASATRDGSVTADADATIQEAVGREIARAFPGDALVGDERPSGPRRRDARYGWVLDPIDGTSNFARGLPGFAISIGVLRDGVPFAGAVYDPIARWLFTGCAGRGAWLNDRPLQVRSAADEDGMLFSVRTPCAGAIPEFVEGWMRHHRVRRFGSTALHLCYVAAGGLDFVHDERASLWDIAGAAPILLEAGGMLTTDGGSAIFPPTSRQTIGGPMALLAGTPGAHACALADIRAFRRGERAVAGVAT